MMPDDVALDALCERLQTLSSGLARSGVYLEHLYDPLQAIAAITKLRARLGAAQEALEPFANPQHIVGCEFNFCPVNDCPTCAPVYEGRARAAYEASAIVSKKSHDPR